MKYIWRQPPTSPFLSGLGTVTGIIFWFLCRGLGVRMKQKSQISALAGFWT